MLIEGKGSANELTQRITAQQAEFRHHPKLFVFIFILISCVLFIHVTENNDI